MKKKIAFILALAAVAAMTSCGSSEESSMSSSEVSSASIAEEPAAEDISTIDDIESAAEELLDMSEPMAEENDDSSQFVDLEQIPFIDAASGSDTISGHIVDVYSDALTYILDDNGNVYVYERDHSADDTYNVTLVAENTELTAINFAYHSVLTILTQEQGGYLFCDDSHIYDGSKKLEFPDEIHDIYMHQGTVQAVFYGIDNSGALRTGAYTSVMNAEKELYEVGLSTAYDISDVKDIAGGFCLDSNGELIDFTRTRFVAQGPDEDGKLSTFQSMGGTEDIVYLDYEKTPVRIFPANIITSNDESAFVMNDDNTFEFIGTSLKFDAFDNVDLSGISGDIVGIYPVTKKNLVVETADGYYSWSEKNGIKRLEQLDGHKVSRFYAPGYDVAVVLEDGNVYNCRDIL